MFIRIDPSIPVVWRDSETVQFGLDPEHARLGPLDLTSARGIAELVRGTSVARLASIVGGEHAARSLIDSCGEVFHRTPRATLPRLAVVGVAPATDTIARTWAGSTRSTVVAGSSSDLPAVDVDFVLLVSHFVVSPIDIQPWLGRDIPHCQATFQHRELSALHSNLLALCNSCQHIQLTKRMPLPRPPTWIDILSYVSFDHQIFESNLLSVTVFELQRVGVTLKVEPVTEGKFCVFYGKGILKRNL